MIADALVSANSVYHFEEVIFNPELYLKYMHDDLLNVIRRSKKPELNEAASLLRRIDSRELYKLVGEASIHKHNRGRISAEDICAHQQCNGEGELRPEDLIVHFFKLDWGNGESYPLDKICFFDSSDSSKLCQLSKFEAH